MSPNKPCLSFAKISISTVYVAFSSSAQATSIILFSSFSNSLTFTQSFLCIDTPLPFVIYPTISSPGSGLQHFDSLTKQLSIPFTTIPKLDVFALFVLLFASSSIFSSIVSSSLCSFLYSISILAITLVAEIVPNPVAAYISSRFLNLYLSSIGLIYSTLNKSEYSIPILFSSLSIASFPFSIFSAFLSFLNHCCILLFALVLFTNFSQSRLGPFEFSDVIISTISPFLIGVIIGTILLFIFAPVI